MSQPRLSIARIATDTPMGAQAYEGQVIARAADAMGPAWSMRELVFRSMRSPLPGNRRLPMGRVAKAPASVRRELGRALFRGDAVSHRTSLELPPSPHADVITLHDVVAWRFADESAPVPAAAEEARRAAAVICVSEFTATEAVEFLGCEIRMSFRMVSIRAISPRHHSTPQIAHGSASNGPTCCTLEEPLRARISRHSPRLGHGCTVNVPAGRSPLPARPTPAVRSCSTVCRAPPCWGGSPMS